MSHSAEINEGGTMDVAGAAAIVEEARERAERELGVDHPVLFAAAGLVVLLGYGGIWLSVRGQHPYQGPTGAAIAGLLLLVVIAVFVTASVMGRVTSGVSGVSSMHRRIAFSSLGIGYVAAIVLEAALSHAGASRAVAYGVFAATAPVLVTGVVYIANSAVRLDWPLFGLGVALVTVAAAGAFAGAVTVWAVVALAGGLAFWLKAAVQFWLLRS